MTINDIVPVTITAETKVATAAGFGTPCVASYHTVFPERVRTYTETADMISDGFATNDPAVIAAGNLFAQNPSPTSVVIGRTANDQVKVIRVTPDFTNLKANYEYSIVINGTIASYTTDATPAVDEITAGLVAAIDLLGLDVTTADNTTDFTITGDTVAERFSCYTDDWKFLFIEDETTDAAPNGIVADLVAIREESDSWYELTLTNHGKAVLTAAAAYIETLPKLLIASSADKDILTTASDDIGSVLKTAGYTRTALMHHPNETAIFAEAGWAGKCLPSDPGSITWKFKTLAGIPTIEYTSTQITNMRSKNVNFYNDVQGIGITEEGYCAAGTSAFIDITRSIDFLTARIQERVFTALANAPKIPFTTEGIIRLENEVRGVLGLGVTQGIIAESPAYTVTVPLIENVPTADKAVRLLDAIEFEATLAGAIHKVVVRGRIVL